MILSANLGFPSIGVGRELKRGLEGYWGGQTTKTELLDLGKNLRKRHWEQQKSARIDHIPSHDFSFYDRVLDAMTLVGAIPKRYRDHGEPGDLDLAFTMARGGDTTPALEMTKWFDTNYHYLVPELCAQTTFSLTHNRPLEMFLEAQTHGITTRPVLLGPISFLLLSKMKDHSDRWALLPGLIAVYQEILEGLCEAGVSWIQMDEPCLVLDLDPETYEACRRAYAALAHPSLSTMLTTYFGPLEDALPLATSLPVAGLHLDAVRAEGEVDAVCALLPEDRFLSLGLVDGRNIWKTDLAKADRLVGRVLEKRGNDRLILAPSCSLMHVPVDLERETEMDQQTKEWLSFAVQKLDEVVALTQLAKGERDEKALEENARMVRSRKISPKIHDMDVQRRTKAITPSMLRRQSSFPIRMRQQKEALKLPPFPTTTIGSYPQTSDVRKIRADFKHGRIVENEYEAFLEKQITKAMDWQERIDLDVPVHGEFERNDMVEYFGEKLNGFCFTQNGWVQSYGSRCVKPPIIYGDVSRPYPITVRWTTFAQGQTSKPVKGMLTGPVTLLNWSFARDDQPRALTCQHIALAIRDEVLDLEKAGIKIIQIDEAALREGLPLRKKDWQEYLKWAVEAFKLTSSGVKDSTQIHTHMCYSEFNDIIEAVSHMDADVLSIETSRSDMELLQAFLSFKYPNHIGPGVYDIHSPKIPTHTEIQVLLEKAMEVLDPNQIWVNPDCGLKTRSWSEVKPALEAMVSAAKTLRTRL